VGNVLVGEVLASKYQASLTSDNGTFMTASSTRGVKVYAGARG
jgi:hypothetical protein